MGCLDDAKYTLRVVVKKFSFMEDYSKPITEEDWNKYQNDSKIKTFTADYPMDQRVYQLKESLCKGGYIPSKEKIYNQTRLYMSGGFGETFKEIPEGNSNSKFNNSYCQLFEIVPSVLNTILLVVVNDYERKWEDEDESDEPYPGWQSLIDTTNI